MPFLVLAVSFGVSVASMPLVRRLCFKVGRVAMPRDDRWHRRPTPTLGGIGIFFAFVVSLIVSELVAGPGWQVNWGLLAGSGIMFALGLYDDFKRISPPAKLVGQILAAAVAVALGYVTTFFTPRLTNTLLAQVPNILLTFAWLIGITNAINLLDNMDGLAGGIALITAGILSYLFWDASASAEGLLVISLALAGSVLGFLVFNFPPASIFMGDSGSLFLGFTLAILAIARQPQASNVFAVMGVPTLIFLLPILDTTLVTITRIMRGQSPAQGGRDHTSHRLIAFGLTERQAVLSLYGVALVSGLLAIGLESLAYWFSLVLVPIVVIALALLTAYLGGLKVVSTSSGSQGKAITRIMLELTYKRRLLEIVLDFFLIGLAYYLAFLANYGLNLTDARLELYLSTLPIALGGSYLSFFVFGVYRGVWRYVGVDDLLRYVIACLGSVIVMAVIAPLFYAFGRSPSVLFLLFGIFLFLGLLATRSSFKILDQFAGMKAKGEEERVLIWGASDAGEMALRWILMNPQLQYRPVGFLDQDPFMTGRQIHGVEVLGCLEQLSQILERFQVDGVILTNGRGQHASGDAARAWEQEIITTCHQHGCWVRGLRLEFQLLE